VNIRILEREKTPVYSFFFSLSDFTEDTTYEQRLANFPARRKLESLPSGLNLDSHLLHWSVPGAERRRGDLGAGAPGKKKKKLKYFLAKFCYSP
jgi:hypothetical protein